MAIPQIDGGSQAAAAAAEAAASAAANAAKPKSGMGHEEFLTLLVAQLENQDPLNPMEGTEFAAQLAQFSSLEQLMQINEGISGLKTPSTSAPATFASLLGTEVALRDPTVVMGGANASGLVELNLGNAAAVRIELLDGKGAPIAVLEAGQVGAGPQQIDLASLPGAAAVAPGTYGIRATTGDEQTRSPVPLRVFGTVTGIDLSAAEPKLVVGGRRVEMSDVIEIRVPDEASAAA